MTGYEFAEQARSGKYNGIPYSKLDCQAFVEEVAKDVEEDTIKAMQCGGRYPAGAEPLPNVKRNSEKSPSVPGYSSGRMMEEKRTGAIMTISGTLPMSESIATWEANRSGIPPGTLAGTESGTGT